VLASCQNLGKCSECFTWIHSCARTCTSV